MANHDEKLGRLISPDDGRVLIELYKTFLAEQKGSLKDILKEAVKEGYMEAEEYTPPGEPAYFIKTIPLDTARDKDGFGDNAPYTIRTNHDYIHVLEKTGDASVSVSVEGEEEFVPLSLYQRLNLIPHLEKVIRITNPAQPGQHIKLFIGGASTTRLESGGRAVQITAELPTVYNNDKVAAADNTSGLTVPLTIGERSVVDVFYNVGGAAAIDIEVSVDGENWYHFADIDPAGAEADTINYRVGHTWVRATTDTTGIDLFFQIAAKVG